MSWGTKLRLLLLFFFSTGIRLYYAHLDPYLHDWDEKFHALVARNMMDHPWIPRLIAHPALPYDPMAWTENSVWLHKQPLFMWQMALSMQHFGVSEYSIRYPSVLMGSVMVIALFRIAYLLTQNKKTAWISALLFCFSGYHLELVSGYLGIDHNDTAFGCYILLSFWALAEYFSSGRRYWSIFIGLFVGLAVLNKWLVGFLVILAWGLLVLLRKSLRTNSRNYLDLLLALFVALAVFLPWQIHILQNFPEIAHHEYQYNARHITETIEGHGGDALFYISQLHKYLGWTFALLLPWGIWCTLRRSRGLRIDLRDTLIISVLAAFVFFSLLVRTKMLSYCFIVAPLLMIMVAIGLIELWKYASSHRLGQLVWIGIVFLGWYQILFPIQIRRQGDYIRDMQIANTKIFKKLNALIPPSTDLVFHTQNHDNISIMFYHPRLTAYDECPDSLRLDSLRTFHRIVGFESNGQNKIPEYFKRSAGSKVLKIPLHHR